MGGDHEYDPLHEIDKEVSRCADALERIADALERPAAAQLEAALSRTLAMLNDVDWSAGIGGYKYAAQRQAEIAELEKLLKKPG